MTTPTDNWSKRRRLPNIQWIAIIGFFCFFTPNAYAANVLTDGFSFEKLVDGLSQPTSVAFDENGRIFVAQKQGVVRVIKNGVMLDQPFITLQDVNDHEDRGLIGIALDPAFSSNGFIYLAYTHENDSSNYSGPKTARVVRVTAAGDIAVNGSALVILGTLSGSSTTPSCDDYPSGSDCIASDSASHTIGGLRFGPDDKLYVSIGDGAGFSSIDLNAFRAQDLDNLSGKILRIETDGRAATGNPYHTGNSNHNRSKVWAYGFRNPYRFNLHPVDGRLISGDVGWAAKEEINSVLPGNNYGWPCREGTGPAPDGYATLSECSRNEVYQDPIYEYVHVDNRGAVTGGAFATSSTYPSWFRGNYVFADFSLDTMQYLTLDEQTRVIGVSDLATDMAGPVEILTGPDGLIYYLSIYRGELLRLDYTSNTVVAPPIAEAGVTTTASSPLTALFDASGSSDPQGATLIYHWDFGDGTSGSGISPKHTYESIGSYQAILTVIAQNGNAASTSVTVVVDDSVETDSKPYLVSLTSQAEPKYLGSPIAFTATLGNEVYAGSFTALFEIFNDDDQPVGRVLFESQQIAAGYSRVYDFSWLPVEIGHYYVSVGLYRDNWSHLIHPWINRANEFDVVPRSSLTELCQNQLIEQNDQCDESTGGIVVTPQSPGGEPVDNLANLVTTGGAGAFVSQGKLFNFLIFVAVFLKVFRWSLQNRNHFNTLST